MANAARSLAAAIDRIAAAKSFGVGAGA